ncbi:Na(+)/H(+) exchange regulatory cofactor NHE-RF1, partial [Cuculus canorus]
PRLCHMKKGPNGYGFNLHSDRSRPGQYVRAVDPDSPAEAAGLAAPDRLIEVQGRALCRDAPAPLLARACGSAASSGVKLWSLCVPWHEGFVPVSCANPGSLSCQALAARFTLASSRLSLLQEELRPRLCHMKKGPNGYGFNLHSDRSRPGQYVRAVDPDSPAEAAGLAAQDRIIEVNGVCMEGKQHADVVAAIKAGGDETKLLVVDVLTDEFFKKCKVVPSEEHLAGPLPEPVANGDVGKENGAEPQSDSVAESPASPGPLATSPASNETHSEPEAQEDDKRHSASDPVLDLDIPLAVAKERAHQKRTSKRAPQMDWSKKNELFSNL